MPRRLPLCLLLLLLPALWCPAQPVAQMRAELRLDAWRFQPGRVGAEPVPADWVPARLPYNWTETWTRPKAAETAAWATQDLRDTNSAWYEADATAPAEWQGRRVALNLRGVQCDAIVEVDGRRIGEIKGPDGRVDLTGVAVPGKTAKVRLWVTRWWERTENQRSRDLFRDVTIEAMPRTEWYHTPDEARRAIPGGLGGVSLLALPALAEIENVAVATSVRRHELSLGLDYRLLAAAPGARFQAQVTEIGGTTEGLPAVSVPLQTTEAGQSRNQTVVVPWDKPHLWDVGAPHLYLVKVSMVGADGAQLDAYPPVRFGFREVWTEGKELMLNGHPLHLRPGYFTSTVPEMLMFEGIGFNAIYFQPNPTAWYGPWGIFPGGVGQAGSKELLDAADERGWAVLMPVPGVSIVRDTILKPEAAPLYMRDLRMWMRELDRGNRPSILMWAPSMNTQGVSGPQDLGRKPTSPQPPWFAASEKLIRSADATRLIYHHQGGQTGDMETANIYLNWVPLAEQEQYLAAWSKSGEKPWGGVEHGSPLSVDFFKHNIVPLVTEYSAIYLGDAAYAAEKDEYIKASARVQARPATSAFEGVTRLADEGSLAHLGDWTAYYSIMDRFIRGVNKAWRAYGLNGGIFPWFFDVGFGAPPGYKPGPMGYLYENLSGSPEELHKRPTWANPLYDAYRDTMQPLLVYLGGPVARFTAVEPRYTAGETAERSIVAVWDGPGDKAFTARWELQVAGKRVVGGEERFAMAAGAIEKRQLRVAIPAVTARTPAQLRLSVTDAAGAEIARDETPLTLFPHLPAPVPLAARWGLFDPAGQTAAEWVKVGLQARPVKPGESLAGLDVLVIGRGALARETRLPFTPEDVARGLRVLVLEQELAGLEALGFRGQDVAPRYVFPRVGNHPALAGVTADDLANWRGEGALLPVTSAGMRIWPWAHGPHCGNTGSVASVVIETPHKGAFTPLMECEFDLAYTPLLSWRHGKGEVIYSQLDFAGRLGAEPAADRIARNLLRHMDKASLALQSKQALVLGKNADVATLMADLGLQWRAFDGAKLPALAPGSHVVVVAPGGTAVAGRFRRELASFVSSGGTVAFLPQDGAGVAGVGLPWALPVQATSAARAAPEAIGDDPLLRGVGPQLVHWRTFLEGDTFAAQGLPPGAKRLLDGWLLRVAAGKGNWVFCQVDWRRLEDGSDNLRRTRWNARRLYRQLFTNLGIATDESVAAQMLEGRTFAPMAPVNVWQVLQQATPITLEPVKATNTLPGLAGTLEAERWVQSPTADKRRDFLWRLRAADANGYLDLTHLEPAKLGQAGYAVTYVFSSVPRKAVVSLSADYWLVFRVNGVAIVDQSTEPRPASAPRPGELRLSAPLHAGWNRLEMKVGSGSGGFGFWCQVSDPGDLRLSPTVIAPTEKPGEVPQAADLRREPPSVGAQLLYAETLQKEDDPYGFTPW